MGGRSLPIRTRRGHGSAKCAVRLVFSIPARRAVRVQYYYGAHVDSRSPQRRGSGFDSWLSINCPGPQTGRLDRPMVVALGMGRHDGVSTAYGADRAGTNHAAVQQIHAAG